MLPDNWIVEQTLLQGAEEGSFLYLFKWLTVKVQRTHDEAIVASILTVEEAIAGLKKEQTCLGMVVVRGDTKCSETFTLSQQLLLTRVGSLVWCGLRKAEDIYMWDIKLNLFLDTQK